MGGGDTIRIQLPPDFLEELVPQIPRGFLLREMSESHMPQRVDMLAEEGNLKKLSGLSNKCLVTIRLVAPELVINMSDRKAKVPFGSVRRKKMQQDHGINSAAHGNNNRTARCDKPRKCYMMGELICQCMVLLVHDRL